MIQEIQIRDSIKTCDQQLLIFLRYETHIFKHFNSFIPLKNRVLNI